MLVPIDELKGLTSIFAANFTQSTFQDFLNEQNGKTVGLCEVIRCFYNEDKKPRIGTTFKKILGKFFLIKSNWEKSPLVEFFTKNYSLPNCILNLYLKVFFRTRSLGDPHLTSCFLQELIDKNISPNFLYQVVEDMPVESFEKVEEYLRLILENLLSKNPQNPPNLAFFKPAPDPAFALTDFEVYTVYPQLNIAELNFHAELAFLAKDINLKLPNGNNLLHTLLDNFSTVEKKGVGAEKQQYDFLKITLDTKISVQDKDKNGRTAFTHFLDVMNPYICCPENFKHFIQAGANADEKNSKGLTTLHMVYDWGTKNKLGLFIAFGMNPEVVHPQYEKSVSQLLKERNESGFLKPITVKKQGRNQNPVHLPEEEFHLDF